ncbi:MAG TPA: hypothetical protein VM055_05430, partial [Novosphingobium sp.]|nr:hypothetical protein [Novosphingobium sp.]
MIKQLCAGAALWVLAAGSAAADEAAPQRPAPPPAVPVTETYFGTTVTDPYRYMETKGDPVFDPWIRAEGRYSR